MLGDEEIKFVGIVLFFFTLILMVIIFVIAFKNVQKEYEERGAIDGLATVQQVNVFQGVVNREVYEYIKKDFLQCYNWRDCLWSCLYTSLKDVDNPSAATYENCFDVCEVYN